MIALRGRDFRRLWLAGLISDTGDWMLLVALPVLVYQLTGSALGTSMAFLIELIPAVVISPLAGRLADRCDRRLLLVAVSLGQAAGLLPLLAGARLPVLYGVIAYQAALAGLFDPAKNALLPALVAEDQLVAANSLIGLNQNLGRLVGAAAGGAVLAAGGLPVIVIADAATFLLSATLIRGVHLPRNAAPARGTPARRPGGRAFARRPVWVALVVTAILAVGQGLFTVLFVVFVARNLHGDAAENGLLRAVQAIGAIIGGLALARATRVRPGPLTGLACLVFAAGAAVTWNLPHLTTAEPVYVALFIGLGVPSVAMDSGLISSLQHATADGERGGVFAAFGAAFALGQAAGIVAAGILGDRLGAVPLLNAQALCYLVGGVAALAGLAGGGQEAPPGLVNGVESPPMRPAGPEGARERAELAVTARRCAAQRLGRDLAGSPEEVAGHLLAIQAQDPRGARLAIRARSAGLSAADVDAALTGRRSMIVTWLNRGTLYLVRSEDYWWLHPLTTPQLRTGNARRLAQEGAPLPGRARPGV